MKGLIVYNGFRVTSSNSYKIERLEEEFKIRGVDMDAKSSLDLLTYIENGQVYIKGIEDYSFCFYLDKDEALASSIEKKIPLFNSASALIKCNDKGKTFLELNGSGINMPKTILSRLCYRKEDASKEKIRNFCLMVANELSFPLVCKECYGSLGLEVYLIKDMNDLLLKEEELLLVPHLYQEFVKTSIGMDYRIFTVGGKVVAYMKRFNPSDFRSNIALGGKGYTCSLSKQYIDLAEKASSLLKLDYAGVDILKGKDDTPLLSEVNSNAFFTEIENISKVNVTSKVVEHILAKISR